MMRCLWEPYVIVCGWIEDFIVFNKLLYSVFKGTLRRVRRGDTFTGSLFMALDEEEQKRDEEIEKLIEERNRKWRKIKNPKKLG